MDTRVLKGNNPALAMDDRLFLGEGLFETLKVEHANPRHPLLHWQRLSHSAKHLGIPFAISFDDWLDHLLQHIKKDNLQQGGIKAILTGGSAPRGLAEKGQVSQLLLQTFNYTAPTHPVRLTKASWLRDAANPIYGLKSINYLEAIMARRQALALGLDDALFYNLNGHATETTCANLFLIKNNTLITPALSEGVLPGITRQRIILFCAQSQIPCLETEVSCELVASADLLFICNALQGVRVVSSLDEQTFKLTHLLLEQISAMLKA